ncbi:unnamed protein product [Rhizophagus irregularis]|nr:unnamed protein product [Rhizophagus irregularis]
MNITENYIGYDALVSYLIESKNQTYYYRFLSLNQDIIISSLNSLTNSSLALDLDKWQNFDVTWYNRFLNVAKNLFEPDIFVAVKDKTSKDSSLSKTLQPDLQIIKEYEKENLVLAETDVLLSKKTVKIPVENHSETLQSVLPNKKFQFTAFCYDILHALENKSYANLFYKYIERDIKNKIIKHLMDLFTIKLKLKNNQYTSLEEFEYDIRLIFCNCYTYNDVESEIYSLDRQTRELKRVRDDNTEDTDRSWKKQIQTLEQNKNNLTYRQVVNDALLIASAYENLVIGFVILVIGFRRILCKPIEEVISNYNYNKI